jgi:hypothetical protein
LIPKAKRVRRERGREERRGKGGREEGREERRGKGEREKRKGRRRRGRGRKDVTT